MRPHAEAKGKLELRSSDTTVRPLTAELLGQEAGLTLPQVSGPRTGTTT